MSTTLDLSQSHFMLAAALVILAVALFIGVWFTSFHLIARLGGWRSLASFYRTEAGPPGPLLRFRYGRLGAITNYNACLSLAASPRGLYLSLLPMFRPGHPPLLIPWSEVEVQASRGWSRDYLVFRFAKQPASPLRLSRALGEQLLESGGVAIPKTAP
jgi:hypothetical protein